MVEAERQAVVRCYLRLTEEGYGFTHSFIIGMVEGGKRRRKQIEGQQQINIDLASTITIIYIYILFFEYCHMTAAAAAGRNRRVSAFFLVGSRYNCFFFNVYIYIPEGCSRRIPDRMREILLDFAFSRWRQSFPCTFSARLERPAGFGSRRGDGIFPSPCCRPPHR